MASPLYGTAIVTGGNSTLGSEIVLAVAREKPLIHILITAGNLNSGSVSLVSEKLRMLGPRSYEIAKVDLESFASVRAFAAHTVGRVKSGDIPPVSVLVNCAAACSFAVEPKTQDGFDIVYQTNCLSPFLLTVSLLEAFWVNGQSKVINIGSSVMAMGKLDYFQATPEKRIGAPLSLKGGLFKYGSSKLVMSAAMYALRRSLSSTTSISLPIVTLDPGCISSRGRRSSSNTPTIFRIGKACLSCIGPLVRVFSRSAINDASVPAQAVAHIAFNLEDDEKGSEKYFVLDRERQVASVLPASKDNQTMEDILKRTMIDTGLDLGLEGMVSPEI